ncbi:PTS system cellobiose-specific IIB component [Enterococcus sp. PF1-24]|uniref:PTS sugar transporter subunit IIB n=1 Tax=unclassified Enterococcus TaxID=2608891 RepID=UPI002475CEB5|nr:MULTISPECIES: PTS sugar transporter subunit IIB [unclassified Enterococcus]MDH6364326.1 PTS system cellobiose-specific IIB component [Enterococcus sp. PFB1-1]MDH6401485.1 PTS system cellobiose-specific IIB component [Enterococcus sp. PF1-24]
MKKILLACAGGFSTSMLVNKMKEAATEKDYQVAINAVAETDIEEHLDANIILLGPQIAHRLEDIRNEVNIPVEVIDSLDYGMMNGAKVLDLAWEKIN